MLTNLTKLFARHSSEKCAPRTDPKREQLHNLIQKIRCDFEYCGTQSVPPAQTRSVAESCRQLLSCMQGHDVVTIFKGINAFVHLVPPPQGVLRERAWTRLTEIVESPDGYSEGQARDMMDILDRALQRHVELDEVVQAFIVRKLHVVAVRRGLLIAGRD